MVGLKEKDEWTDVQQAGRIDSCLLHVLEPDGHHPFHARLAEMVKRKDLPRVVADMIRGLLAGYGGYATSLGKLDFALYMTQIQRLLPNGIKMPNMGRKHCEVLYIGAMLVALEEGTKEWLAFKNAWNKRMARNLWLP